MGSSLRILLPENTTVKQMPGKTVYRPLCVCATCVGKWDEFPDSCSVHGFVDTLVPRLENSPLSAISVNYCHRSA